MKTTKLSVILTLMLAGCDQHPPTTPADSLVASMVRGEGDEASDYAHLDLNAERADLLDADRAFSQRSASTNLVEGIVGMLAPEVAVVGPRSLLRTPEEVRASLSAVWANLTRSQVWTPVRADVSSDGRHGYTYGYFEIRAADGGLVAPGKYISYWRRQEDGSWKVSAYKRVGRPAGPVSDTPPAGFGTPDYEHYRYFPGTTSADAREAVMDVDRAFSDLARSGVSAAFQAYAAEDGAVLGGTPEIAYGREAIGAAYASFGPGALVWWPVVADAAESGDLAFTTGDAEIRRIEADGTYTVLFTTRYLSVWKRQRTGEWRMVIDG